MPTTPYDPPELEAGTLRIVPLGGLGEVGRNMTVFEYGGKLLIVDCGVLFPEEHQPGVDLILPDFEPIKRRLTPLRHVPVLRTQRANAGAHIRHDFADRRIFAGDRSAAKAVFRIGGDDGERGGDWGVRGAAYSAGKDE